MFHLILRSYVITNSEKETFIIHWNAQLEPESFIISVNLVKFNDFDFDLNNYFSGKWFPESVESD